MNNIEDVVLKSKQIWKITYGLATTKDDEQEPINVEDDEEEDNKQDTIEEGIDMNIDDRKTTEEE